MKIPIVLAVAVVFALLRFLRANLLMWAAAWWAGIYVILRFGFVAPIPSSVVTIYMGIATLAILAYLSSSQPRREEVMRNVRWAAELAVDVDQTKANLGVWQLNAPSQSIFSARL